MDTGAIRSCINYNTFRKLNVQLMQREVPRVMGADGGDLGSMGTVELTLSIGVNKVAQEFIVCIVWVWTSQNVIVLGYSGLQIEQGCCH